MKKLLGILLGKLGYRIEKKRSKQDRIFSMQKKLSPSGTKKVIFDVGAYHGDTVLGYHHLFGGHCEVYAFEPFEESYQLVVENTSAYSNIHVFKTALGDEPQEVDFHVNNFTATNSILKSAEEGMEIWGAELMETKQVTKVPMQTIDDFVKTHEIEQIDILKLDVQGAEYLVLKGAEETIRAGKVKQILSELIVVPTYDEQKALHEMLGLYHSYGFELYKLFESCSPSGQLRFLDGIFIYKGTREK